MTRRNVILVAAGVAALLIAWYLLVWSPKTTDLSEARGRTETAEAEAIQLEQRLQVLRLAAERAPELSAAHERVRAAVPDQPDLAQFLLAANAAAKKAGVEYLTVTPQPPALQSGPAAIGVNISVKARYEPLLGFMEELLGMPRVLVIDSLQVSPGGDDQLAVSLTGRTFTTWSPGVAPTPAPTTTPSAPTPAPANDQVAAPTSEVTPR